jgi:hypothetical protein
LKMRWKPCLPREGMTGTIGTSLGCQKDMVPKPAAQEKGQECKMKDQKVVGDTVTYSMEIAGKMTYKGDVFDGSTDTTVKTNGQTMQMSSKMTGKYVGPCTN